MTKRSTKAIRSSLLSALLAAACGSGGTPSSSSGPAPATSPSPASTTAAASASATADAGQAPTAALEAEPEVFAQVPGLGLALSVSETSLYFDESINDAEPEDRIVRMPLDAPTKRVEVTKGKLAVWSGAGDHLLVSSRDDTAQLVYGPTKKAHEVGPFAAAAWGDGAVYVARGASDKPEIVIEAIALDGAPSPKRVGVIPKRNKLALSPTSMAVGKTHLYVAVEEEGPAARTPGHVFSVPLAGGDAKHLATVTNVHQLAVVGGELFVGSLARADKLEPSGTLTRLEGSYWDFLTTDGKVAHYFVATSLPQGGIGGYLYAWAPPAAPERIYEHLRNPMYVVMNKKHVYWIDRTDSRIMRIARAPGR